MLCATLGATFVVGCGGGETDREAQRPAEPAPAISPTREPPKPSSTSQAETRSAPDPPASAAPDLPPAPPPAPPAPADDLCPPGGVVTPGRRHGGVRRRREADIGRATNTERRGARSFGTLNANGHVMVFRIRGVVRDDCGMLWYYASLPIRPNGVAGFVPAATCGSTCVHTRITIDLSKRELVLYRDGEPVLRSAVAIGAPGTPTPTGRYYVNQRLIASDPGGPWGPGALGISAFSDVLQEWIQGGPIAIHGTNDPSSIGRAASHGCVRLPNDVLMKVFNTADAGTPVIIQA